MVILCIAGIVEGRWSGVVKIAMDMPSCCYDCWALDESTDYPMCRLTGETRGNNFGIHNRRMPYCPLIDIGEEGEVGCMTALR